MARGFNSVQLIGSITKQPELRYTGGGLALLDLNLAGIDTIYQDGQLRNLPWYHRVTFFAKSAEILAENTTLDSIVFVDARVNFRSWEQNGEKRSSLDLKGIRADVLSAGLRTQPFEQDNRNQNRLTNALNAVTIVGNLTNDVELRYTPNGNATARLNVAVNESYKDKNGNDNESVHFVPVQLWRDMAESCADLTKGAPVLVTGRFVGNSWEGKDGTKRYQNLVEANRVEILERPNQAAPAPQHKPAAVAVSAPPSNLDIDEFPPEEDLPF